MKIVHVAVEAELDSQLAEMAKESSWSKAQLIREALAQYVDRKGGKKTYREMRRYAERMARYSGEFVAETGPAVDELILKETEW